MKRKTKEMLGDYCPLDRCPWRNNSAATACGRGIGAPGKGISNNSAVRGPLKDGGICGGADGEKGEQK